MTDEFYIGWEHKAAPGVASFVRRTVILAMLMVLLLATMLAVAQRNIGVAVFEFGIHKQFAGIFRAWPYPHLLVPRPVGFGTPESFSTYFLVAPWKFGLSPEVVAKFDGKFVSLQGTLIYRENQTMIEVNTTNITEYAGLAVPRELPKSVLLGTQTFVGEIVDSKCYFGVMNPGQLTSHRACAVVCIQGGIPPVLVVRSKGGRATYLLLASAEGKPLNQQVLDYIAEPVQITGALESCDGLLVLRADPTTIVRR